MIFFVRCAFLPTFAPEIYKYGPSEGLFFYQKELNDKETTGFTFVLQNNVICQ